MNVDRVTTEQIVQEQGLPPSYLSQWESVALGAESAAPRPSDDPFAPYRDALEGRVVNTDQTGHDGEQLPAGVLLRKRVAEWIGRAKKVLDPVDDSIGTQPDQESPFASEWQADAVARRLAVQAAEANPEPVPVRPTLPPRGPWIMSEVTLPAEEAAAEKTRQMHDAHAAATARAIATLKAEATARVAAAKEAKRLARMREDIVAATVKAHPEFGWLTSTVPEDQAAIDRVIKTVEEVRARTASQGKKISDSQIYRKYRLAADQALADKTEGSNDAGAHGSTDRLQKGYRIVEALMGGSYKGKLPF